MFFWSIVADAAKLYHWELPPPGDLEYRALWALCLLTGLLSSFPGLKEVDSWILKNLHRAALIPDSARLLAEKLHDAPFKPDAATRAAMRKTLIMRDTIRVAERRATGSLENSALRTLWLQNRLERACNEEENFKFRVRIQRDLTDINHGCTAFVADARRYLYEQEKLIPERITDIDEFLEGSEENELLRDLCLRRAELRQTCDALFFPHVSFDDADGKRNEAHSRSGR